MNKDIKGTPSDAQEGTTRDTKKVYNPPKLKEHGSVEEVTLQTFFGTFSPPPTTGK